MQPKATRDANEAPSPTTLRRDVQTMPTRLRRISCIDVDYPANGSLSLFANQTSKNSEARIEHRPIEASLSRDVAAGFLDRALRRSRHASKIECFEPNHVGARYDPMRNFMQCIKSSIRLAFLSAGQTLEGCQLLHNPLTSMFSHSFSFQSANRKNPGSLGEFR
jgi:hypothetical protein